MWPLRPRRHLRTDVLHVNSVCAFDWHSDIALILGGE